MRPRPPPRPGASFVEAADGTRVAWRSHGAPGAPPLVICNGLVNDDFFWRPHVRRLERRARVVTWDYRGHGDSEAARDLAGFGIEACTADLLRVMDAAGVQRAPLLAFSLGCQVALEAVGQHPERVSALVLVLGTSERPFDSFYGPLRGRLAHLFLRATPPEAMDRGSALLDRARPLGFLVARALGAVEPVRYREFRPWFDQLVRHDTRSWMALALGAQRHSAHALLGRIAVPVLVVAGGRDAFAPPRLSRAMAEAIPGAELCMLPRASHAGLLGHAQPIGDAVDAFLDRLGDG